MRPVCGTRHLTKGQLCSSLPFHHYPSSAQVRLPLSPPSSPPLRERQVVCFAAALVSVDVEKHVSIWLYPTQTGVCDSIWAWQPGSCNCAPFGCVGYREWVGRVTEAPVFQPLIPQNYSYDQAGSALHGCWGHTTQPWGQPANYRPLCPVSLSPLGRWQRHGNRGKSGR